VPAVRWRDQVRQHGGSDATRRVYPNRRTLGAHSPRAWTQLPLDSSQAILATILAGERVGEAFSLVESEVVTRCRHEW